MRLPAGFRVRLAEDTTVLGDGAVLVGGSPLTSLRLAPRARGRLQRGALTVSDPVGAHLADRLLATNLARPDLTRAAVPPAAELTVVIPVRDRAAQLDRCLAALAGLDCIVVDDASHDPAAVARVVAAHGATLVALSSNVGPAGARNAGLARVDTPYVAFVDSDVQVTPAQLRQLARHLADPAVSLVGPKVVGRPAVSTPRWFERYEARASSLTLGARPAAVRPGAAVAWLPSACLVARTAALGAGFDPALRAGEDVDLVWRLTDAGHRVRYDPTVRAHHDTRASIRSWLGRKAFYGTGGAALAARHGSYVAPAVLSPAYAVAGAALLVRRRALLPVVAAALLRGGQAVARALPAEAGADALAARLALRGLGWSVRQESALLLRHWWPAAAAAAFASRHARRALLTALLVDVAVAVHETDDLPVRDLPAHLAARRLDDLAYGAGLWWGAVRGRTLAPLQPRRHATPHFRPGRERL